MAQYRYCFLLDSGNLVCNGAVHVLLPPEKTSGLFEPGSLVTIYGWRLSSEVPELFPLDQVQSTVRVLPLNEMVYWMMQSCISDGQYSHVRTPFFHEKLFSSFPPRLGLTTSVTTYPPFSHTMVEIVPPPLESGSIHFPARPGIASPGIGDETSVGAEVATGIVVAVGAEVAAGTVVVVGAEVAAGTEVAAGAEVTTGALVTSTVGLAKGVAVSGKWREEHEQAMIVIPATAPIKTSQNLLLISISLLLWGLGVQAAAAPMHMASIVHDKSHNKSIA